MDLIKKYKSRIKNIGFRRISSILAQDITDKEKKEKIKVEMAAFGYTPVDVKNYFKSQRNNLAIDFDNER